MIGLVDFKLTMCTQLLLTILLFVQLEIIRDSFYKYIYVRCYLDNIFWSFFKSYILLGLS